MVDYICIDIEASGLHKNCYPIEVALALPITALEKAWLIAPTPEWRDNGIWEEQAEALHGITRADLFRNGVLPEVVVGELIVCIGEKQLVSDCPSADGGWLQQLFAAADVHREWRIHDLDEVARRITWGRGVHHEAALSAARTYAQTVCPKMHRALPDARHNAAILQHLNVAPSC